MLTDTHIIIKAMMRSPDRIISVYAAKPFGWKVTIESNNSRLALFVHTEDEKEDKETARQLKTLLPSVLGIAFQGESHLTTDETLARNK